MLSSSIVLLEGASELIQTAHELGAAGGVTGVQMWRMSVAEASATPSDDGWQDEEAFMTSGSEL